MTTPTQNMILPWIELHNVSLVYAELVKLGLGSSDAERIRDVISCPGVGTCQVGVTASRNLAHVLDGMLGGAEYRSAEINPLRIRVSGCHNACSRHHVADIGFHGLSMPVHGQPVPHYEMLVGGGAEDGRAWFGTSVSRIPARRVPAAVEVLLRHFQAERQPGESFRAFTLRFGAERLQDLLRPHATVGAPADDPDAYRDWHSASTT